MIRKTDHKFLKKSDIVTMPLHRLFAWYLSCDDNPETPEEKESYHLAIKRMSEGNIVPSASPNK